MDEQENEPRQAQPPSPEEMAKLMPPFPGGKKAHNVLLMDDGPQKGAQLRQVLEKNNWGVLEASSLYEAFQGMLRTDLDVIIVKPSSDESAFSYARLLKERMEARSSSRNIPIAVVPGGALSKEAWANLKSLSSKVFFYNSRASGGFSSFIDGLLRASKETSFARATALSPSALAQTSILDAIGIDTVLEAIMKKILKWIRTPANLRVAIVGVVAILYLFSRSDSLVGRQLREQGQMLFPTWGESANR